MQVALRFLQSLAARSSPSQNSPQGGSGPSPCLEASDTVASCQAIMTTEDIYFLKLQALLLGWGEGG